MGNLDSEQSAIEFGPFGLVQRDAGPSRKCWPCGAPAAPGAARRRAGLVPRGGTFRPASVCSRKRHPGTSFGGKPGCHTESASTSGGGTAACDTLEAVRMASARRHTRSCRLRSILAVGRDLAGENGGPSRSEIAGPGSGTKRSPPAAQRPMQSPDRAAVAAAGPPTHSFRLCHLPVQSEPRSPSTPRHCGSRCCWVSRPAAAARCEPGVFRRPHTRELLCTPAPFGVTSHAPQKAEPTGGRVMYRMTTVR